MEQWLGSYISIEIPIDHVVVFCGSEGSVWHWGYCVLTLKTDVLYCRQTKGFSGGWRSYWLFWGVRDVYSTHVSMAFLVTLIIQTFNSFLHSHTHIQTHTHTYTHTQAGGFKSWRGPTTCCFSQHILWLHKPKWNKAMDPQTSHI